MYSKLATSGILSFFEKIGRAHPLLYIFLRSLVRYTNIFEKDFDGVRLLKFKKKVNIMDVGASDGIATKFLSNNLNTGTIYCFEPSPPYIKILKKINVKNVIVKPFAIGDANSYTYIYFPRYKFFKKKFDIVSYTSYGVRLLKHYMLDFKFRKNLSIIKEKILIKKINKINKKIHLIKIDTNGNELFVIKGLINIIKKDKPALIVENNPDSVKIMKLLKKYSYKGFYYSIDSKKFTSKKNNHALNRYYLQKKHLNKIT
jgi:FkbM family methyltransferase